MNPMNPEEVFTCKDLIEGKLFVAEFQTIESAERKKDFKQRKWAKSSPALITGRLVSKLSNFTSYEVLLHGIR